MSDRARTMRGLSATWIAIAALACGTPDELEVGRDAEPPEMQASAGDVVLDVRADGARVVGALAPVLRDSDADRVLVLAVGPGEPAWMAPLEGARVLDARFTERGLVVLGADRVLRLHGASADEAIPLDDEVYGPLSVAGDVVAYVRGAPPDLELARVDVRTGAVESLTRGMAPVWSPALSPDGAEVVFVSGVEGSPRLHRLDAAGVTHALARTERTPSAPTAPRWIGATLVFEDEAGLAWVDLERGGEIVREEPGARGLTVLSDGRLGASTDGLPVAPLDGLPVAPLRSGALR